MSRPFSAGQVCGSPATRRRDAAVDARGVAIRHHFPALGPTTQQTGPARGGRAPVLVSLEISLHNAMLAVRIALSRQLLDTTELATPAAVYGFFAPVIALADVFIVRRVDPAFRKEAASATDENVGAEAATAEIT